MLPTALPQVLCSHADQSLSEALGLKQPHHPGGSRGLGSFPNSLYLFTVCPKTGARIQGQEELSWSKTNRKVQSQGAAP